MPQFFGSVECNVEPDIKFSMYCGGGDDAIALRFYWNGCYENATLALWAKLASNNQYILDIGAHTGAYTLAALSANKIGRVFSFEPHFMNYARLNLNLRLNGYKTENAFMLAIGENSEVLPFSISTSIDYLSSGGSVGVREGGSTQYVQAVAIDEFFDSKKFPIQMMKIDVEGYEGNCLRGMKRMLQSDHPIIFFECINSKSGKEVQNILDDLGYQFFIINDETGDIRKINEIHPMFNKDGGIDMNLLNRVAIYGGSDSHPFIA
jgi:FkbM family methyltransferase